MIRRIAVATFALSVVLLAGCASQVQAQAEHRLVDYMGRPCGNQNMHVKMPVCLFPRME